MAYECTLTVAHEGVITWPQATGQGYTVAAAQYNAQAELANSLPPGEPIPATEIIGYACSMGLNVQATFTFIEGN